MARPRKQSAKKTEAPTKIVLDANEIKDQDNAENQSKEIEQDNKEDLASEEKVKSELDKLKEENAKIKAELAKKPKESTAKTIEVTTGTEKRKLTSVRRPNNLHDVYVKGRLRSMTKQAYEAVAKDQKLKVSLPKGSILVEPKIQPCIDC